MCSLDHVVDGSIYQLNLTYCTSGTVALPNLAAYSSSKYAVEALSLALRDEMHKWGVGVSVVRPGPYTMCKYSYKVKLKHPY